MRAFVDLLLFRSYSDLLAERQRTYLGFAWWLIAPAAYLGTFVLVFGNMFGHQSSKFVPYLLVGVAWWHWFSSSLSHGSSSILDGLEVQRQVRVAPVLFPLVSVLTDTYKFLLVLVVLLAIFWAMGYPPHPSWFAIPFILVANVLAIAAATTLVAACVPLVPDARFALDSLLHVWMFVSGVFYYREQLPESARWILDANPTYAMITTWRDVLMDGRAPSPAALILQLALGAAALVLATAVVRLLASRYAKAPQ